MGMVQPNIQAAKDTYPRPAVFDLYTMPLAEYLEDSERILGLMMQVAEAMVNYAVHYDRDKPEGSPVLVGACGAIALLGVMNEQTYEREDLVVFSVGANIKADPDDEKYCGEWHITDDADAYIEEYGEENVEVLDVCVASPTPKPRIKKVLNVDRSTLCPCHNCTVKLAGHRAVTRSTGLHMKRMDGENSEGDSTDVGHLVQDLSTHPKPRVSNRDGIASRERYMSPHHTIYFGQTRKRRNKVGASTRG